MYAVGRPWHDLYGSSRGFAADGFEGFSYIVGIQRAKAPSVSEHPVKLPRRGPVSLVIQVTFFGAASRGLRKRF